MSETCIKVVAPNGVEPGSWLNEPAYESFRAAYVYASTQSAAIPSLAELPAEAVYHLYEALKRGEENYECRRDLPAPKFEQVKGMPAILPSKRSKS